MTGTESPWLLQHRHTPNTVQLFEFSAVTENAHRIHYDQRYAEQEGYPGVLVHSHLHEALLARLVTSWAGARATLTELDVTMRRYAAVGDPLLCRGRRPRRDEHGGAAPDRHLILETVRESDGEVCATALASFDVVAEPGSGPTEQPLPLSRTARTEPEGGRRW